MNTFIKVQLNKTKETKNTVRYDHASGPQGEVANVYVSKDSLKTAFGKFPEHIEVTIGEKSE